MNEAKYNILHPDVLICSCCSVQHQILFIYNEEDNELYTEIHLVDYNGFWKRLWYALKYTFGYKCQYGAFDSVLIDNDNKHQFQKALDRIT